MSNLMDTAIAAHGGLERWDQIKKLTAHMSVAGAIWRVKGWPDRFADTHVYVDPHRQHVEYSPFGDAGRHTLFEAGRVAIVSDTGGPLEERKSPRDSFKGHSIATPWDELQLIYFSSYAIWTYLTVPFTFKLPGFKAEEVEPWNELGETWRGLKVTFPDEIESHSREQTFYFDSAGLLRRHDYSVDIIGGSASAHYVSEHRDFGGIIFPTKRRVYSTEPDKRPVLERIAVSIDIHNIVVG